MAEKGKKMAENEVVVAKAKGKKMAENEVVVAKAKEADFGDIELKISKPALNQDKTISVHGNFVEIGNKIQSVVDRYKNTKLTEDNVDYVKSLKKQFVSLRTGIELQRKEYKKAYFDPAEELLNSMCKELLKIVDEGESALGKQLDEYDQKRKNELTEILNDYVREAVEKYALREEYATQIQLKKEYYNKTQKEEESIADIDLQASELAKKQKEYDAGVELIKAECEDAGLLPDAYVRELNYKSATEITLEIKMDKKARAEMQAKAEEGKVTIGADPDSEIVKLMAKATELNNKEDEIRERVLKITYKASQAKLIVKFFTENHIGFKFIETNF